MTLFLHIGMQKTGTTSLQSMMRAARDQLSDVGILYPDTTLGLNQPEINAHHYLAHAVQGQRYGHTPAAEFDLLEQHCAQICAAAATFEGDTVLSSEDLSRLPPEAILRLRALLPEATKVVIYLRRQDFWLDSFYGHSLKLGTKASLQTFIANEAERLDYEALIGGWSVAFDAKNIIIRTYERRARRNLWTDFCTAIRRPEASTVLPGARRENVSLSRQQIALLDETSDISLRKSLRRLLERHNRSRPPSNSLHHLSLEEAEALMAQYADSNSRLAQSFFKRDNLFVDTTPPHHSGEETEDLDRVRAMLATAPADRAEQKALLGEIRDYLRHSDRAAPV